MTKRNRKILFVTFCIVGLLTEAFIFYLFPYTGLGGLICYPTSIFLSLLFGWTLYKITKKHLKPFVIGLTICLCLLLQVLIELYVHPQDFGGSPFQQISEYKNAYTDYDKIDFDNYTEFNNAKRVAFIYKFKDRLPKSISTLRIDSSADGFITQISRKYMLLNFAKDTIYDTNLINFKFTDTSLIIIENPKDSSKTNTHITDKYLLKNEGGGISAKSKPIMYTVWLDKLDLKTGIEKMFYNFLSLTKKASRQH